MLHPGDRPQWLDRLHSALRAAHDNHESPHGIKHIHRVVSDYQRSLNTYQWNLVDVDATSGFDFDSVYNKYKAENRISELFDEIITALSEIARSGEIDSVRTLNELPRVIATLQRAKDGSYFATHGAWIFAATWFRNTGWELLGEVPVLGAVVRGLRKTLEDMEQGMCMLHEQMHHDIQTQLSQDFPQLEYHPPALPQLESRNDLEVQVSQHQFDSTDKQDSLPL